LMITLAVVAILATIAVPGFWNLIQNNRVTTQTNELVSALNLARSEAIKRGIEVRVTPVGGDFADGWCVHLGVACAGNDIIREYTEMRRMAVNGSPATLRFDGRGEKIAPGGTLLIRIQPDDCTAGTAGRARFVEIINTGRVSVTRTDC